MWQSVFCPPWQSESDGCFDPAQDLTYPQFVSERSTHPHRHTPSPLEHTSVHKQRSNCRGLETNVPQRHLSWAGCDVTWLQIVSLALVFSRGGKRRDSSSRCKACTWGNGFHPSVWEIYHSVFTSHSVLLTPHLQQSKCYHCAKWAGMHVRVGGALLSGKPWLNKREGPRSLCKQRMGASVYGLICGLLSPSVCLLVDRQNKLCQPVSKTRISPPFFFLFTVGWRNVTDSLILSLWYGHKREWTGSEGHSAVCPFIMISMSMHTC